MIRLNCCGCSDKGSVKSKNEDAYIYRIQHSEDGTICGLFAVSDGVGGLKNGDIASSYIMTELENWWNQNFKKYCYQSQLILESLEKVIHNANQALIRYGKGQGGKCGATLSILLIYNSTGYIFHTGDSRIYRLVRKPFRYRLEQLTANHSRTVEKQTENGTVMKNYLTECIGAKENFKVFHLEFKVGLNEIYLLCSDGVYKSQPDKAIIRILKRKRSLSEICSDLLKSALKYGETDNITAVIAEITERD